MSALGREQTSELARITFSVIAPAACNQYSLLSASPRSFVSNIAVDLPLPCKESSLQGRCSYQPRSLRFSSYSARSISPRARRRLRTLRAVERLSGTAVQSANQTMIAANPTKMIRMIIRCMPPPHQRACAAVLCPQVPTQQFRQLSKHLPRSAEPYRAHVNGHHSREPRRGAPSGFAEFLTQDWRQGVRGWGAASQTVSNDAQSGFKARLSSFSAVQTCNLLRPGVDAAPRPLPYGAALRSGCTLRGGLNY